MAAVQQRFMSSVSSYPPCRGVVDEAGLDQFPAGLRVLVVDDDTTCLKILEQMLQKCRYQVTICCQAMKALSLLRERRGGFDVVISDVHMPDMDGFKLLELVGLEMDLPVIMMSADGRTSAVMRGIKHGACDYLIKPVRMEELKNIWQHVIRKKWNENKEIENSSSLEDPDRQRRVVDDTEYASSPNMGTDGTWKAQKKKRDSKEEEDDGELDNEDPSAAKKPRVVWSVELHQQFVSAVNQLGIDKAVPKRILELMNVPGLTRENVASHLQKFRLYLKRLSGVTQHQSGLPNSFCGSVEPNGKVGPLGRLDFQALAASGQIPPQTLAALHAELLGRPSGNLVLPAIDQSVVLQATQAPNSVSFERGVSYGQPTFKCQADISKQRPQTSISFEGASSSFPSWSSNHLASLGSPSNLGGVSAFQNSNSVVQMLQQQKPFPLLSESQFGINMQPSSLVVPSQSTNSFQMGNNPVPVNASSIVLPSQPIANLQVDNSPVTLSESSNYSNISSILDYGLPFSQSRTAVLGVGQNSHADFKDMGLLNGYSISGAYTSPVSSCSGQADTNTSWPLQNMAMNYVSTTRTPAFAPSLSAQASRSDIETVPAHGPGMNLGFVGKGTSIPSRFGVDDIESQGNNRRKVIDDNADKIKQELLLDFVDGTKARETVLSHFSHGDIMGVLSK